MEVGSVTRNTVGRGTRNAHEETETMENILTDEELERQMVDEFIAAWNRNYGGLGGKMSRERIEREEARTKRLDAEASK